VAIEKDKVKVTALGTEIPRVGVRRGKVTNLPALAYDGD
jgi:hypothetical protein